MKKHIPNILTLLNLFFGCCALVCIFSTEFISATSFLILSGICDYADGTAARLLNIKSDFGKEVDSLADMVSFGVVPGAIVYMMLVLVFEVHAVGDHTPTILSQSIFKMHPAALPAFIISAFSCYRLAKFNLDVRQTEDFIGLATPANTLFFLGLLFVAKENTLGLGPMVLYPYFLYALIPISSYLLISEIPMFSFKLKGFVWKGNEIKFIFASISLTLLVLLKGAGLAFIIILYVLLNVFLHLVKPKKTSSVS
jgi:CDP-diacylglycerol---serine O-phosphatidyltransferase